MSLCHFASVYKLQLLCIPAVLPDQDVSFALCIAFAAIQSFGSCGIRVESNVFSVLVMSWFSEGHTHGWCCRLRSASVGLQPHLDMHYSIFG